MAETWKMNLYGYGIVDAVGKSPPRKPNGSKADIRKCRLCRALSSRFCHRAAHLAIHHLHAFARLRTADEAAIGAALFCSPIQEPSAKKRRLLAGGPPCETLPRQLESQCLNNQQTSSCSVQA